jgi:hypothetical protein
MNIGYKFRRLCLRPDLESNATSSQYSSDKITATKGSANFEFFYSILNAKAGSRKDKMSLVQIRRCTDEIKKYSDRPNIDELENKL